MSACPKPSRRDRLAARRAEREQAILRRAEIRHDLIVLARDCCCACGRNFRLAGFEAHHLASGSGKRRQHESLDTMAPTCIQCHGLAHENDETTLRALLAWAEVHCSALAVQELRRRLSKLPSKYAALGKRRA